MSTQEQIRYILRVLAVIHVGVFLVRVAGEGRSESDDPDSSSESDV